MDITGVPFAMQVAASPMKTTRAALLLGAEVIVVGMRPQVAQGFIRLGIDLQGITLHQTLGSARSALRRKRPAARRAAGPLGLSCRARAAPRLRYSAASGPRRGGRRGHGGRACLPHSRRAAPRAACPC